jgi:Transposase, Mutator family
MSWWPASGPARWTPPGRIRVDQRDHPEGPRGRVNVHALIATGVNADGHRQILGLDVASSAVKK